MALIKCPECGKEISDAAISCPNCGTPISQRATVQINQPNMNYPKKNSGLGMAALILSVIGCTFVIGAIMAIIDICKKDGKKKTCSIIALIICGIWLIIGITYSGSSGSNNNNASKDNNVSKIESESNNGNIHEADAETEQSNDDPEIPQISEEEFKSSCQAFDYKTIARNPNDYIGQNFVVDVKVFQSASGKWYSDYDTYYKAYTNDEYDIWMGDFLYIIDRQDKDSENYVKVLEDDIIRVYGTFNGMSESKNALTNTTSEDVSLDMFYCELLEG